MGSANFSAESMFGSLSDVVGVKSGLALSKPRILEIFANDDRFARYADVPDDAWVRIESVIYQEIVELLLFAVGRLEKINNVGPMATLLRKYGREPETVKVITGVGELFVAFMKGLDFESMPTGTKIDP